MKTLDKVRRPADIQKLTPTESCSATSLIIEWSSIKVGNVTIRDFATHEEVKPLDISEQPEDVRNSLANNPWRGMQDIDERKQEAKQAEPLNTKTVDNKWTQEAKELVTNLKAEQHKAGALNYILTT